jgi:tRNA dimethylallyltransferase
VRLAEEWDAEIVSVDSRQVYKELSIGTAKPGPAVLDRVPHHFIGERSVRHPLSAGEYADLAHDRIREIRARNRAPLVVGGATLYIHALQYGLADIPDVEDDVREWLENRLENEGADALFEELKEVDPTQADKNDPTKTQRVIRALEVYHGTGQTLTYYHKNQTPPPFFFDTVVLNRDRERLYDRINQRVDQMLEDGLMEEVEHVMKMEHIQLDEPPLSTIGYREPIQYLKDEIADFDEMVRLVKRNTRRYAKRQLTWFRRYDEYTWRDAEETTVDALARHFRAEND